MRVLIVGGAGRVGSIALPVLMAEHDCFCFDLAHVTKMGDRSIVGDVNDPKAVRQAVSGVESIVYLPMGGIQMDSDDYMDEVHVRCVVSDAFDVHVQGFYRFLWEGLAAGIKHFVYASTLSVYWSLYRGTIDESVMPNAWDTYGVTKRLGEQLCAMASQQCPEATIIALRLIHPKTAQEMKDGDQLKRGRAYLGPKDTAQLFLTTLSCHRPGVHIVQTSSNRDGSLLPNIRATELLGWRPSGD